MTIVKLTGGLGNQMFQYALYRSLVHSGRQAAIDDSTFKKNHAHEEISLESVFPELSFTRAVNADILKMADLKIGFWHKVRRNVVGIRKTHIQEKDVVYKRNILHEKGDRYLDGYWQSEKYFNPIERDIRSAFSFKPLINKRNIDLAAKMKAENSVAIHVRKGSDFQSRSRKDLCNVEFYRQAIDKIGAAIDNPVFYVFSDNFAWCKANLGFSSTHFVDWNPPFGEDSYLDMQLMSMCRNNIIANSTYSWWSGWLNPYGRKMVIAPAVWFNARTTEYAIDDILPASWNRI